MILTLFYANTLVAQYKPFTKFDFGIYGGINFHTTDNIRGDFLTEFKVNIIPTLELKVSTGYIRTIEPYVNNKTVRKYSENTIDTIPRFFVSQYYLVSKNYDIFPQSLGILYKFNQSILSPYISFDIVYNILDHFIDTSPPESWTYNSLDEIPAEFKENQKTEKIPNNSFGMILGVGTTYLISSNLNIDIRYLFKYDNKIINTHHFIFGIIL